MSTTPDNRPILLRRQKRPAPAHGPNHAPRPPVTGPVQPTTNRVLHRNGQVRL